MIRDKEDSQLSFLERKVQNNVVYLHSRSTFLLSCRCFFFSFWNIFVTRNTIVAELKSSVTLYDVCVPLLKDLKSFINSQALQQVNSKGTHF